LAQATWARCGFPSPGAHVGLATRRIRTGGRRAMSAVITVSPLAACEQEAPPVGRWRTLWHQFTQRRLKVWQPILAPRYVIPLYLVAGLLFVVIGAALLISAGGSVELSCDYTDVGTNEHGVGYCDLTVDETMEGPTWVQYHLQGFFQNHRRYVKSYSPEQLAHLHTATTEKGEEAACEPAQFGRKGRPLYPCGLVAASVFNDTFAIAKRSADGSSWSRVDIVSDADAIARPADKDRYKNIDPEARGDRVGQSGERLQEQAVRDMWILEAFPPVQCEQVAFREGETVMPVRVATKEVPGIGGESVEVPACTGYMNGQPVCEFTRNGSAFPCEGPDFRAARRRSWGVESGHFMVWMRIAGFPSFRKLWGRIDETLEAGTQLRLYFVDNYPVKQLHGRKSLLLTSKSSIGGPGDWLGYGSLALGCCCVVVFVVCELLQLFYRPRLLGDISYLTPETPAKSS